MSNPFAIVEKSSVGEGERIIEYILKFARREDGAAGVGGRKMYAEKSKICLERLNLAFFTSEMRIEVLAVFVSFPHKI